MQIMNNQSKGAVTAVMHETGAITAFFNELPGLVVQGNSHDDVKNKLNALIKAYIRRLEAMSEDIEIETETL